MTRRPSAALHAAALAIAVAAAACVTGPEPAPEGPPPEFVSQELELQQDLTTFNLRFQGQVKSARPATLERAAWEMVVDGKVVKSGEQPLDVRLPENGPGAFDLRASSRYVTTPAELKAMSDRGGSLLAALRGTLFIRRDGKIHPLPFARSREVRTPRLPTVKLQEIDGARYSDQEVDVHVWLGVVNPNPFPLGLSGLDFKAQVANQEVASGTLTRRDTIEPAATGVFEITFEVTEKTHGPGVKALIKSLTLPWSVAGVVRGELFTLPYDIAGTMRLNVSK
jgi:hypothetical protein